MATDTFAEERLSAAFKRWDHTRTVLHQKRRQLGALSNGVPQRDGPERMLLGIEVKCIDELCDQLFAQLMAIANQIEGERDPWAALAVCGAQLGGSPC